MYDSWVQNYIVAIFFCVQSFQILFMYLCTYDVRLSQWFDGADDPIFG